MEGASKDFEDFARRSAGVIPDVDSTAERKRCDPGIGPFEEDRQIKMILAALAALAAAGTVPSHVKREVTYPGSDLAPSRACHVCHSTRSTVPASSTVVNATTAIHPIRPQSFNTRPRDPMWLIETIPNTARSEAAKLVERSKPLGHSGPPTSRSRAPT